jgi:hypothetical protein
MRQPKWLILCLLALVLGADYALVWWARQRLTPLESELVGRWYQLPPMEPGVLVLIEYRDDRSVQVGYFNGFTGARQDRYDRVGRWRVEGDLLINTWEGLRSRRLTWPLPFGQGLAARWPLVEQWLRGPNHGFEDVERLRILAHTANEVDVLPLYPRATTIVWWRRYTGNLQLPARTLPPEQ